MTETNNEVTFEITEHIGVIAEHPTGWTKELNRVDWNHKGNLSMISETGMRNICVCQGE